MNDGHIAYCCYCATEICKGDKYSKDDAGYSCAECMAPESIGIEIKDLKNYNITKFKVGDYFIGKQYIRGVTKGWYIKILAKVSYVRKRKDGIFVHYYTDLTDGNPFGYHRGCNGEYLDSFMCILKRVITPKEYFEMMISHTQGSTQLRYIDGLLKLESKELSTKTCKKCKKNVLYEDDEETICFSCRHQASSDYLWI